MEHIIRNDMISMSQRNWKLTFSDSNFWYFDEIAYLIYVAGIVTIFSSKSQEQFLFYYYF